jgi:hypothetical protein
MDGDEIWSLNQVGTLDRAWAKAKMGDSHSARFFGVIDKIALGEIVGFLTYDLDRVLVGADSAVGAKPPEQSADLILRLRIEVCIERQTGERNVIGNAD